MTLLDVTGLAEQLDSSEKPDTEQTIQEMLDRLAEYQAQQEALRLRKQELIDGVLTPEIRQHIADIEVEFLPGEQECTQRAAEIEANVRAAVLSHGKTVKGGHLQAVLAKGRVSWDTKGIDGYAMAHPELFTFRKEGEPSVSIRKV